MPRGVVVGDAATAARFTAAGRGPAPRFGARPVFCDFYSVWMLFT
jgi:hypothetical protein